MLSNTHFSMAVHVLCALASDDDRNLASEYLAQSVGTNPSFLRGLIGKLRNAGLVETTLGSGGGAKLAKPQSSITLSDVYLATESGPAIKAHVCDGNSECPVARGMNEMMGGLNHRIEQVVKAELDQITIGDLIESHVTA